MQLFQGVGEQFIELAGTVALGNVLKDNFTKQMRYSPSPQEVKSWQNSLREVAYVLKDIKLIDAGIIVEYRLPQTNRRLDVMITGRDNKKRENALIVELKQWERAEYSDIEDCVLYNKNLHLHPSRQAGNYAEYLADYHTAFYSSALNPSPINLDACSFLHNALKNNCGDLLSNRYVNILECFPLYTGDLKDRFAEYLYERFSLGDGEKVLQKVTQSRFRPSKKLLENTALIIEGNPTFTLLDEQQIVFNVVLSEIKKVTISSPKTIVIVTGGPGTGKSVIAVRLLAALAKDNLSVVHCTGSAAFTTNLRAQVGRRGSGLFKYFNSFSKAEFNEVDVLIADEAHRIRETSNNRFIKKSMRSSKSQIKELIDCSRVGVFLLDDNQVVRPDEIGTPELIETVAKQDEAKIYKVNLNTQFRCSGSDSYINWVEYVLGFNGELDLNWKNNQEYDFKIYQSPEDLENAILSKFKNGLTARLVAGFCWSWSDPLVDGTLVPDVKIGKWERPWNRKRDQRGYSNPKNDPYTIWATKPDGIQQIGCIYSAQGFEFDYCGVIIGNDLIWNEKDNKWEGHPENSKDPVVKRAGNFTDLVKNTYRVLLTRGMKGTYVYFLDKGTKKHFENSMIN